MDLAIQRAADGDPDPAALAAAPAAPTAAGERLAVLDVLRGCALYGVLLANTVPWFSGRAFMPRATLMAQTQVLDRVFLVLLGVFVNGKAMALLTFLFGLGFALQLQRAEAGGRSAVGTHLRRMAALALIGIGHVLLLWWGDILWSYALAGAGLLLFRRQRGSRVLLWAFALALIPQLVFSLPRVAKAIEPILAKPADFDAYRAQLLAAMTGHDRRLLTQLHLQQVYYHVGRFWVPYIPGLWGHFLIGYWAGTQRLFQRLPDSLPLFRKLAAWGLGLGLAGSSLSAVRYLLGLRKIVLPEAVGVLLSVLAELGTMLLACGYAAAVVLLLQRAAWRRVLLLLAPVGQMALTTYLMQSLLCTFLFYGWGLGLIGRVRASHLVPITLAVFVFQILFAHAWLARFRFGPLEWLWRSLTYGRLQPMGRGGRATAPQVAGAEFL